MNTRFQQHRNGRSGRSLLIGVAVLIAGSFVLPTTVEAHGQHHRGHGHHVDKHKDRSGRHAHYGHDLVPRKLHHKHRDLYHRYFSGRAYYKPHRHHHAVYSFPVFIGGRLVHRPYSYCDDDLYLRAGVRLPRLALDLTFVGPDGFYLGGVYRSP